MNVSEQNSMARAQDDIRLSAQWLALLHFRADPSAPIFSPCISTYHDMLDPSADGVRRLEAAEAMLKHVRRQAVLEGLKGEEAYATARPTDPYGRVWKTTERGAALHMIEMLLSSAVATLGGSPQ